MPTGSAAAAARTAAVRSRCPTPVFRTKNSQSRGTHLLGWAPVLSFESGAPMADRSARRTGGEEVILR